MIGNKYGVPGFENRFYDSCSGKWTTKDPLGEAGGMNLYGFVGNKPVNYIDPFGLLQKDKLFTGLLEVVGGIGTIKAAIVASAGTGGLAIPATIGFTISGGGLISHGVTTFISGFSEYDEEIPPVSAAALATLALTKSKTTACNVDTAISIVSGFKGITELDKLSREDYWSHIADMLKTEIELINNATKEKKVTTSVNGR